MDQQKGTGIEELVQKAGIVRGTLVWHIGHGLGRDAYVADKRSQMVGSEYLHTYLTLPLDTSIFRFTVNILHQPAFT